LKLESEKVGQGDELKEAECEEEERVDERVILSRSNEGLKEGGCDI
jgi:hypothetical protein